MEKIDTEYEPDELDEQWRSLATLSKPEGVFASIEFQN